MDKVDLQLESLKMTKEWSVWLVALQAAICGFLWNSLKENPLIRTFNTPQFEFGKYWEFSPLGVILHLAWLLFALSLLAAAFLLLHLPGMIENLKKNEEAAESVMAMKAPLMGEGISIRALVFAEYFLFLAGVVLTALFVLIT